MAITVLLDPGAMPNQQMEQPEFDAATAQLMTNLPTFGAEANALAAGLNSIAAGGAIAIPYTFSTTVTDADPGVGYLRLNNATQSSATVLRADLSGADLKDWTGVLDSFDDSTSVVKGQVRLCKLADPTKWMVFNLTSMASPTGYKNLTVALVDSSDSNPFVNGDSILLFFTRTGDIGTTTSNTAFTSVAIASVNIDFSLGNFFHKAVAGVTAFTFSNVPAGGYSMTVEIQLDSGSFSWPASVKIARNQVPTFALAKTHQFYLNTRDGGARFRMTIGDNFDI